MKRLYISLLVTMLILAGCSSQQMRDISQMQSHVDELQSQVADLQGQLDEAHAGSVGQAATAEVEAAIKPANAYFQSIVPSDFQHQSDLDGEVLLNESGMLTVSAWLANEKFDDLAFCKEAALGIAQAMQKCEQKPYITQIILLLAGPEKQYVFDFGDYQNLPEQYTLTDGDGMPVDE